MINNIYLKLVEKLRRSIKEMCKNKIVEDDLENRFKNPKPEIQTEKRNYEVKRLLKQLIVSQIMLYLGTISSIIVVFLTAFFY